MSNIFSKIRKAFHLFPLLKQGYSYYFLNNWYKQEMRDTKRYSKRMSKENIELAHKNGFLCSTLSRRGIKAKDSGSAKIISDFDYSFIGPLNSSFTKWIEDIITTGYVLLDHQDVCRNVYYSIIRRNGECLILSCADRSKEVQFSEIIDLLREKKELELRPTRWKSDCAWFLLSMRDGQIYINDDHITPERLEVRVRGLQYNYVIADRVKYAHTEIAGRDDEYSLKFWLANDVPDGDPILFASMYMYYTDRRYGYERFVERRRFESYHIDMSDGSITRRGEKFLIPNWEAITEKVRAVSAALNQVSYYSMIVAPQEDVLFRILDFSAYPVMLHYDRVMNYLKYRAAEKKKTLTPGISNCTKLVGHAIQKKFTARFKRKLRRRGVRSYMQEIWESGIKDDLLHTKGPSLKEKIWCWKHGFYSYRLWQYGLTKENYKNFLSDYDYIWLNRINNTFQKWVNDKTTYRYVMEPWKECVPKYYFSLILRNGKTEICRMPDCPDGISNDFDGILELLRQEGKLAFKPSAGTHGDGFYCLAYEDGEYFVNGEACPAEQVVKTLTAQKSFYVLTEYLVMHEQLRKIYPNSVNTIRIMVINEHGYDPEIMQTYMRIGSETTGFTDNVGYGGICVKVDKDTGELYQPQTISKHVFYDCPVHPDTGTEISGFLPHWDMVRESVLGIARQFGELEYLGFDVAITEKGICILEINVHQDLHKVAEFTDEMNAFFKKKIRSKRLAYSLIVDSPATTPAAPAAESETEKESDLETEPDSEMIPDTEADTKAEPEPDTDTETDAESEPDADPEEEQEL